MTIIRGGTKQFMESRFCDLRDGVAQLLADNLALDGHYHFNMHIDACPFWGYATFTVDIRHKDEEYSLHESKASVRGAYFLNPSLN